MFLKEMHYLLIVLKISSTKHLWHLLKTFLAYFFMMIIEFSTLFTCLFVTNVDFFTTFNFQIFRFEINNVVCNSLLSVIIIIFIIEGTANLF